MGGRLSLPVPRRATEACSAAGSPSERRTRSKGEHREALRSWLACGVHVETKQARRWKLASPTRPFAIRWRRLHAQNPPCASHASWTAAPEARSPWRSQNERPQTQLHPGIVLRNLGPAPPPPRQGAPASSRVAHLPSQAHRSVPGQPQSENTGAGLC
ncbi:uncharacterized protein LOC144337148 [Macaca mulatta]